MSEEIIKDDAALWWSNRKAEVQEFETPEQETEPPSFIDVETDTPEPSETETETKPKENVTATDVRNRLNMIKLQKPVAETVVSLVEILFPVLLMLILKADKEECQFDEAEHDVMVEAWAQYLESTNINMSPSMVLVTTMVTVLGAKTFEIINNRKAKESEKALQAQNSALQNKCNELSATIETLKNGSNKGKGILNIIGLGNNKP